MEIRTSIDKDFIQGLKKASGKKSSSEITRDALALYDWALEEVKQGRLIVSSDQKGSNIQRLVMPSLESVRGKARMKK